MRVAHEELGISIGAAELVLLTTMHRSQGAAGAQGQRVDFFFICENWGGEPRLKEPEKAADLAWFGLDGLPHRMVPHERYVFERPGAGLPALTTFGFDTD